jgi:hypothetical protein
MFKTKPEITQWPDAPKPAPYESPVLQIIDGELHISYLIAPEALSVTGHEQCAVVKFSGVLVFSYGYPNDEALPGHPLYGYGLEYYSFNVIENSPRIEELRKQNAVCFPIDRLPWNYRHFIVTFQDETLDVVCGEISFLGHYATEDCEEALELCLSK